MNNSRNFVLGGLAALGLLGAAGQAMAQNVTGAGASFPAPPRRWRPMRR